MSEIIPFTSEDPLAAQLRNAVKKACDPNRPVIVSADAQGNIKPQPPQEIPFQLFPDGALFKHSPNPKSPGSRLLHDAAGQVVALVKNTEIADLLAKGSHIFMQLAQKEIAAAKAKEPIEVSATVLDAADKENEQ